MFAKFLGSLSLILGLAVNSVLAADVMNHANHPKVPTTASAAFDGNGKLFVVIPRDNFIWLRISEDFGKTFSDEVKVNSSPEKSYADGDNRPKIVIPQENEILISYTQPLEKPWTGNIRLIRSSDGGKTFSSPITVNDNLEEISHRFDSMIARKNKVWISWLDKRDIAPAEKEGKPYEGSAIYYAESDDGGQHFKPNIKIADHSCECCRVAMDFDKDGMPIVFWRHVFDGNIRDHAMVRLAGSSQVIRVSYDQWEIKACPHHGPTLSIGPDNIYHFTWFTQLKDQPTLLYRQTKDRGLHFSKPISFGRSDAQAGHPVVLSLGKKVILVWKEFNGHQTTIEMMSSSNAGKSWSKPKTASRTKGSSDHPLLITYKNSPFLSWYTAEEGYRLIPLGK